MDNKLSGLARRRADAVKDKAKRHGRRDSCQETDCPWCVSRPALPARVEISQSLFDMMVEEMIERSALPDERTTQGWHNIQDAIDAGIVTLSADTLVR